VPILELLAEPGGRIREDLEPPQDRILDLSLLEERRTPVADLLVDQPDALSDVFEIASLALAAHSAIASRLIR
jgi:hypothetical protein